MKYVEGSTEYLKEIFKYIGLKSFHGEAWDSFSTSPYEPKLIVRFGLEIDVVDMMLSKTPSKLMELIGDPIIEAVRNSDAVSAAKAEMAEGIATLQEELDKANTEIKRLQEFETYYNLHYKMTNGEK